MAGLLIGALLIACLLLVHLSLRAQPLQSRHPLNVDYGLPLPEAGQASTVFSLTALFGAYFGVYLMLGLPALAGLAAGTFLGLLLIRHWITKQRARTFEAFVQRILRGRADNATVFGLVLAGIQCAFATSELLILREIARVSLGVRSDHATLLAVGLAIVGYFYVLFGGYMAVFRTDVVQFVCIALMAVTLGAVSFRTHIPSGWQVKLMPRAGYWELPHHQGGALLYAYHFAIASVMGLGFLAASPDAWKRVFIVTRLRMERPGRFTMFLVMSIAPFAVLLLLGVPTGRISDGPVNVGRMFSAMLTSDALFVAAALGLVASFLSSFDGALLAAVQLGLILRRKKARVAFEMARFHWLMVTALMTIFFLFTGLSSFSNPYLLANLLLGAYAVIAGLEVGTAGVLSDLPANSLVWILAVGLGWWFVYCLPKLTAAVIPTTYQINTIPLGVLLCIATAVVCRLLVIGGRRRVRS